MKYLVVLILLLGCAHGSSKKASGTDSSSGSAVFKNALAVIERDRYDVETVEVTGTKVFIITRKEGGLNQSKITAAVEKYWPKWNQILKFKIPEIAVIDFEAPLGGGPLGPYVVGLFADDDISEGYQKFIFQGTGWPARSSTEEYVLKYYAAFPDPEEAYIHDIVAHELGHAIFGYGLTEAPKERDDAWFSYGLSLVYGHLIWAEDQKTESPFFASMVNQWEDVYSKKSKIDQRLVRPNTKRDGEFNLNRLQVYGHGKALVYLAALREYIGPAEFDALVTQYISSPRVITYDDFLKTVPAKFRKGIHNLEKQFRVR